MNKSKSSQIEKLGSEAKRVIEKADTLLELKKLRSFYLNKKSGKITNLLKSLTSLPLNQRKIKGRSLNELKNTVEALFEKKEEKLLKKELEKKLSQEFFDVTIPSKKVLLGTLHPITRVRKEAEDIFEKMGFEIVEPREVDDDYHNFESLNMPPGHPARDMWDTFWTKEGLIPITHTSSMQNRMIKEKKPPIRLIIPGRCFRNEATDARHEHTWYNVEGIYVDEGITLADMIGTIKTFLEALFERGLNHKIQPSFFPFVEPGTEFLISCVICDGKGEKNGIPCPSCGHSGWLEIMGCGSIHPKVIKMGGLDPKTYTGFAWGIGLDRLAMLKYGIEDIRLFHSGDLRFLRQF